MNTIRKLRRRMMLLVSAVLVLVTAGIIFSINYMNWKNIASKAEAALETLAENNGSRPELPREAQEPPAKPEEGEDGSEPPTGLQGAEAGPPEKPAGGDGNGDGGGDDPFKGQGPGPGMENGGDMSSHGQPPQIRDALATLSNYYVVTLAQDGSIESWTSDRPYLYTEDQVADMTALALAGGRRKGHIGSQFYLFSSQKDRELLIVLDERLELMAAESVLRTSAAIAAIACLLLGAAAWFLIRFLVRPVQDAFERQRQFVWDASHELKTPLAVIGTNAQVLQGEIGENESLAFITDEVQRTNRMIQSLLALARTDQGGAKAQLRELDLGDVVLGAVLPMESAAFDEGKLIESEIGDQVRCLGDEDMIRQLTVILLSNAIKYSDDGSTIRVRVCRKGKYALLQVADTGEEISPKDIPRLFDRFYRADSAHSREVEGYGLGLSIAKNIAQIHKAKLEVDCAADAAGRFVTTFTWQCAAAR